MGPIASRLFNPHASLAWVLPWTLLLFLFLGEVSAADRYVDFAAGSDDRDGLSPANAWKHAPGDPNATGTARATLLIGGNRVLFKGGVVYKGNIVLSRSGVSGSPIIYKGDGWGSEQAIIDGSATYAPTWTRCASAAECGGNPNYAQIYRAAAPSGYSDFQTALYENDDFLWYSQGPNPADPFYHDEIGDFYDVPYGSSTVRQTQTAVTDPRNLTQTSATAWNGAYVIAWVTGNVTDIKRVTAFDPSTHTITYEALSAPPYTDRTGRYGLMNHVTLIDRAGEYAYDPATARIYLWPRNGADPATNRYSTYSLEAAFSVSGALSYVEVEGFEIRHFTYGIRNDASGGSALNIRNNYIHTLRSHDRYALQSNSPNSFVEGNRIIDANRAVGILAGSSNITVRNNHVERTSRQGIWFAGATGSAITGNTVTNILGTHSNGISIYSGCSNITVSGNKVLNVNNPITFEASSNLTFINNLVDRGQISDWFGMTGTVAFYNNTFPQSAFYRASSITYVMRNNIIGTALSGATRSNNIYTLSGGSLQAGESVQASSNLFVGPAAGDYRLKAGSPAIDTGTTVPVATDLAGVARPQGPAYDIGAYEYVATSGGTPPTITTQPANATVTVGQSVSFTVAAAGTAPLSYQWKRGTTNVGGNAATLTIASAQMTDAGSYTCGVSNPVGMATSTTATLTVNVQANQAPNVSVAPATPSPVTAKTTTLAATASDDGGEPALIYTWSATGPAAVTFSANGSNAAKTNTATFAKAGSYTLTVTAKDAGNLTATKSVAVTVNATPTALSISPTTASVQPDMTVDFNAIVVDQFAATIATQPALTWTVSGGGTINANGLFTAGAGTPSPSGGITATTYVVTATASGFSNVALVTVSTAAPSPTGGVSGCGTGGVAGLILGLGLMLTRRGRR